MNEVDVIVGWLTWKCLSCLRVLVVLNNILIDDGLFPLLKNLNLLLLLYLSYVFLTGGMLEKNE